MKPSYIILLSLLLSLLLASDALPLQTPTKVFIENGEHAEFTLEMPSELNQSSNLIIIATPIVLIPSQVPNLIITSANFTKQCLKDSNQLEGICILSYDALIGQSGQNILLTASCIQKCQFRIEAYLSSSILIVPNTIYTISPSSENIFPFMMQITNLTFDSLQIEAVFEEQQEQQGGVQLFANIGNENENMPSQQIYQYKAISIKKGLGISISKEELTVGSWIKIGIYTQSVSNIDFSVITVENDKKKMIFGRDELCFLSKGEEKLFILDFSNSQGQIQEYQLNLAATIYSGSPTIEVSFKKDFSDILQNYGVSGNLNYLITKKMREQNGFTDKIYIRVSSINSAFLVLKTSFNPLDYVYVEQATTYLSFFDSQDVQNYIFDVYYTLEQGETVEKNLFFTVKIKVLDGFGEYASRICNKQSNEACILHNRQELFSNEFMKQAADLPGSILQYYSLYEIYMYAKVKQCRNIPQKNENNRYLCKIHMVGYNPNKYGQLQWAITSYSRLNNILLVEGHPFKDLVYEDSYNYYSFIVPEEFIQITIFVTTLNGEVTLITSQKYQNPQIIFSYMEGNDIRSNPLNTIKYEKTQLIGNIYIGVYGASMSEFMVNVVVKRKDEESRAIVLVQNIQQHMHAEKGEAINFQLHIQEEAQWVIQVIEIYGQISNKLISQSNTIVCNSFSICRFNSSTSIKLIVNSLKQSKFTIVFYKKSSCRLLQVGSTHFIDIQANTTQCIQFIVSPKDTLISYSQNLLHKMMMHSISLSVKINQNDLGKMDQHYSHLSQAEMAQFCKKVGNETKESGCIMRIQVIGCRQENVEAEIAVFTVDEPIPLYDGVQFVYANNQIKQSKPAYFNYYALTEDKIALLVKSQSSFGYVLAYTWVEYEDYRQVNSYSQIYVPNPASIDNINSFKIGPYQKNFKITIDGKKANCKQCILLVSVFPQETAKLVTFSIEVTASQKMIKVGQTIDGVIGKDEFCMYQVQKIQGQNDAVISFSSYGSGDECYRVNLIHKNTQKQVLFEGSEAILQKGKQYYAIITGQSAQCKYSLSLWQSSLPVKIMQTGYFYSLSLSKSSKAYFIYYHSDNKAFHLFESIKSGSIYSYATPIKGTIRKAIEDDIFLYKSQSIYDSIDVTPDLGGFCSGCYYLIKLVGEPSVSGSIGVVDSNTYPFLVQGQVVRERVSRGEVRRFSYFTFERFRLKLNIIYGKIQLIYKNIVSSAKEVYSIASDLQLDLDAGSKEELIAGYEFTLTMMEQTTYSLQVISVDKMRIIQGYPIDHFFEANHSASFDYNQLNEEDFNLQIIISDWQKNLDVLLSISTKQDPVFKPIASKHIGNIFSYDIKGSSTDYHFRITTSKAIDLKLLITREQLTYLQPNSPILALKPTTYEIFTQGKVTMMQIFSCKGDVEVIASARYSDVENSTSSAVTLEHSNIGGHYVIQSEEGQAEFFITVRNKTEQEPLFLVEYSTVQVLPYKYFSNVEEAISYRLQKDSIQLQIELPQLKEKKGYLRNINAVLKVFATSQRKYRESLGQCGNDIAVYENIIELAQLTNSNGKSFTVSIPQKQLISQSKQQSDPLFIGLIVSIIFEQGAALRKLTYVYQSIQVYLSQSNLAVEEQSSGVKFVIVWMVLPLAIGAVIALLALKYCLKRWHLLSHNDDSKLIEEEQSKNPQSEQLSQKTSVDQSTLQYMEKLGK